MTRARPQFVPEPRIWSEYQVACRLGRAETWLRNNRSRLEAAGFPGIDDFLGGTDGDAIERWLDGRAGLAVPYEQGNIARELEEWEP